MTEADMNEADMIDAGLGGVGTAKVVSNGVDRRQDRRDRR